MKKSRILLSLAAMAAMAFSAASAVAQTVKSASYALGEQMCHAAEGFLASMGFILFLTTRAPSHTGQLPTRVRPIDQSVMPIPIPFDMPAAAPGVNDVLALCKVPAGVEIVDYDLIVDDCDSNGAPTLAFTLGSLNAALTAIATAYAAAQTTMTTGGVLRPTTAAHWLESSAADRDIGILFTAAAATYSGAGKKGLLVLYTRG